MLVYKLTDQRAQTHGGCQWGERVEHTAPGGGELCSSAYLHAYRDLLLAVLLDTIHGGFGAHARAWESDADVEVDDGTKLGCTRLRIDRELPLPSLTTEQRVTCAILAARGVYQETQWKQWADRWLSGEDRSEAAAWAGEAAARAAWAAAGAARTAAWAVGAAEEAAEAAAEAAEAAARTAAGALSTSNATALDAATAVQSAAWAAAEAAARTAEGALSTSNATALDAATAVQSAAWAARRTGQPLDLVAIVHQVVEGGRVDGALSDRSEE